jgi:2-hydroxy-3-keto-5-methylthiopentenyl-1-phosphate phosphatase
MPKIEKHFDLTFSKKFPDGSIASVSFGTLEAQELREDLTLDGIEDAKKELFNRVYQNTVTDIQAAAKTDNIVRSIVKEIIQSVKRENKVAKAEKDLAEG